MDGQATPSLPALRRQITKHRPGQSVSLTVRRDGAVRTVDVKTAPDPQDKKRSIIGVLTSCALQTPTKISLPVPVHIDLGQVGGPSAGLAFALDVAEKLGHDVDHGHRVVASGEMCLDGSVAPRRRPEAEDDRRKTRRSGRLSRSGWGKRTGGAPLRRQACASSLCTLIDRRCARWQR